MVLDSLKVKLNGDLFHKLHKDMNKGVITTDDDDEERT